MIYIFAIDNFLFENILMSKNYSTATSRENCCNNEKIFETSQELFCDIRETSVATPKKGTVVTFYIIYCNIENKSLQNNEEI